MQVTIAQAQEFYRERPAALQHLATASCANDLITHSLDVRVAKTNPSKGKRLIPTRLAANHFSSRIIANMSNHQGRQAS